MSEGLDGLDGVVAARTVLSEVDGKRGRLIVRGRGLDELAGVTSFEETIRLLWAGFFDPLPADMNRALGAARSEVFDQTRALDDELLARPPLEAVRALMARLADGDDLGLALRLVAGPAVFASAVKRRRGGEAPVPPDPGIAHAADILRMMRGRRAGPEEAAALDAYLVTVAEHGLNASTFAARVVASTRAGLASAVIAGLCALKGPLHGGAPGPVIEMLDAIGEPANARKWIEQALGRGERMMGFGHRIYRVRDPRADALKGIVSRLTEQSNRLPGRLAFAEAVEDAVLEILKARKPDRSLQTNVEFYTALLLEALGLAPEDFTCVFAMGRTAGWLAHAREQTAGGRLIRPQSIYVGPFPGNEARGGRTGAPPAFSPAGRKK
ncbi:MAG: citrate synthase/methylcitrate synthase [Caulobacteraceae bacterium]